jgi:MFS family permease
VRTSQLVAPLRERPFRLQYLAYTTSVLGDATAPVAVAFAVLDLPGASATDLGLILAAQALALVLFLLVGGALADRFPRQRLMVLADIGRFVSQGLFAALIITGSARLWELVALQAVNGVATALFQPASTGLTPQTVSGPQLQRANALLSMSFSLAGVGGPVIAGALIAVAGPGWALAVDALTFAGSATFLSLLRLPGIKGQASGKQGLLVELVAGWQEVRSRSWVWVSILTFALFQLLLMSTLQVVGPLIAKESLGGARAWATILAVAGAGSVLGNLIALASEPVHPLRIAFLAGLLDLPVVVLLAERAPFAATVSAALVAGIAWSLPDTLWFTTLQQHIPTRAISRVSSYDWLGSVALRPIGLAFVGPVVAVAGVEATLLGAAAIFGVAQLAALAAPSIFRLERRTAEPPETHPHNKAPATP